MKSTTETAFETYVEDILLNQSGWEPGSLEGWDKEIALFPEEVITKLRKELDLKGTQRVLRHGFKFFGKTFRVAYFRPEQRQTGGAYSR